MKWREPSFFLLTFGFTLISLYSAYSGWEFFPIASQAMYSKDQHPNQLQIYFIEFRTQTGLVRRILANKFWSLHNSRKFIYVMSNTRERHVYADFAKAVLIKLNLRREKKSKPPLASLSFRVANFQWSEMSELVLSNEKFAKHNFPLSLENLERQSGFIGFNELAKASF